MTRANPFKTWRARLTGEAVSAEVYRARIAELGIKPAEAARRMGVSLRSAQRFAEVGGVAPGYFEKL